MHCFSGLFKEKVDDLILDFHSSIHFDKRLYKYDIMGSIAHVRGLAKQGIISRGESEIIEKTLLEIYQDIEDGKIEFSIEYEDIHMNIEKILIDRIGDIGKKLHTGRSRNDQVAVDMKLFVKDESIKIQKIILELIEILNDMAKNNKDTYMPGFTHLQKAQPISFAHYVLAYVEMFRRDYTRLKNAIDILDFSPLGSAALAGTTYPLDRDFTAKLLGFQGVTWNSLDSVSDRDYIIEVINCFSIIMVHLSRFCEELIIFSSNDYGYIEISEKFSTGSSIMPQKKNPDGAELIRGKSGRVFGDLMGILTVMKGTPLAYNKDMQEDKESFFDALDTTKKSLLVFNGMIKSITVKKERLLEALHRGFINATDVADYLVSKGIPFRDAYKITGNIVAFCTESNLTLNKLTIEKYKEFSPYFETDIYEYIDIENCVKKRKTMGAPSKESVEKHIEFIDNFLLVEDKKMMEYSLNFIL